MSPFGTAFWTLKHAKQATPKGSLLIRWDFLATSHRTPHSTSAKKTIKINANAGTFQWVASWHNVWSTCREDLVRCLAEDRTEYDDEAEQIRMKRIKNGISLFRLFIIEQNRYLILSFEFWMFVKILYDFFKSYKFIDFLKILSLWYKSIKI